jgi:hypothetical protein
VESSDAYFANAQNATLNIKHQAEFYFLFFSHDRQWVFAGYEKYGKQIAHWILAFQNNPPLAEEKFHWIRCPPNTLEIFCNRFHKDGRGLHPIAMITVTCVIGPGVNWLFKIKIFSKAFL